MNSRNKNIEKRLKGLLKRYVNKRNQLAIYLYADGRLKRKPTKEFWLLVGFIAELEQVLEGCEVSTKKLKRTKS